MKKYLLLLSFLIVGVSACKKEHETTVAEQSTIDDNLIQAYLTANPSIVATKDASGLYYQVLTPGTGTATPTSTSVVNVNYSGQVLNGSTFATSQNISGTALSSLIQGWGIGIPKIKSGGRILLIIPSRLAYGTSSPGAAIPANAVLIFTIDLLSFT